MSTAADGGLVGDEARAMIGQVTGRAEGRVVREEFQRLAAAAGDRNPLYFDVGYARARGYRDVIAPPLYVQYVTLGIADPGRLRPDGTPEGGDGPAAVPLPRCARRMAGGQDIAICEPLYDGTVVTAVRTITGVEEKRGRSGPFVLVTSTTRYTREDGVLVAEIGDTVLALPERDAGRAAGPHAGQRPSADVAAGDEIPVLAVRVDPAQMFFFSAATHNGHRIHYDRAWAVDVEGYPDIVVQGPLQAALLARAVTDWAGGAGRLVRFGYQNRASAYPGQELLFKGTVTGKREEAGRTLVDLALRGENGDGELLMPGTATVSLPARDAGR